MSPRQGDLTGVTHARQRQSFECVLPLCFDSEIDYSSLLACVLQAASRLATIVAAFEALAQHASVECVKMAVHWMDVLKTSHSAMLSFNLLLGVARRGRARVLLGLLPEAGTVTASARDAKWFQVLHNLCASPLDACAKDAAAVSEAVQALVALLLVAMEPASEHTQSELVRVIVCCFPSFDCLPFTILFCVVYRSCDPCLRQSEMTM